MSKGILLHNIYKHTIMETTGTTSVHFYDISLSGKGQLVGWGLPLVQVLVKPVFPVIKGLRLDNVHEPSQQLHVLQQEMKVSKYQLRIPDNWREILYHTITH